MENKIELSAREMEVLMLCLRGEYDSVDDEADILQERLATEGFDFSGNMQRAVLLPRN